MRKRPIFPCERFLHPSFNVLSLEAQITMVKAYALALTSGRIDREMLYNPRISARRLDLALNELVNHGWLIDDQNNLFRIGGWDKDQSLKDPTVGDRVRRFRAKDVTVSNALRNALQPPLRNALQTVTVTVPDEPSSVREGAPTRIRAGLDTNTQSGLFSSSLGDKSPRDSASRPKRAKTDPDTAWVGSLLEAVRPLRDRRFDSLSTDERYLIARYHCLKFGNCTKTEANNKARAAQVAAGLARFPRSKNFCEMTVGQYVSLAKKVWESREKTPFFDPWLIESAVEVRHA